MTGNSRLLAILGTYKPAPWRGRYSLSRLFFNFYLLVMGSFVAIALFADFVISNAVKGITDDYTRKLMRGTVLLIEDELFRKPRGEWGRTIEALDRKFAYRLDIVDRWTLNLPPEEAEKLDGGELAIDDEGDIIYHRLKQTPLILVLGPISPERNPEYQRGLPLDLRISLLTWSLIGVCLAIVVWLWVHPVWRDLEAMRQTARSLGEGLFEARAPEMRSSALGPLAETLNGMAERIQRLIAMQKELSNAISHELRTPIARLRFALEMLAETEDRLERERLSQLTEADLDELDGLIDASLTYARFEREQPELQLSSVELAPWLEEQVEASRLLARKLDLRVDTSTLPLRLYVELDRRTMPYAVANMLRNAIKYTQTLIRVSAELSGGRVRIHVDDDGIGIPADERERVFSAFTRLDRSRDRATGGYGLGLAIARLVLEQHHGSATAGESPCGGARFTLEWPLSQSVTES
ncbi:ATP-binding protein [Accumulibacter sp.]|uniref:ATP-binding protein n=1 Tax=Accumulibacter sp. TaxID=2053492 RepID=UPI0025EE2D52|nr:ATP-binding protein [Accumulibacter sp.]MCM8595890.1 ATP-binding protein [Accumulibacter sp.]MDS4050039.1 ATP-binding protein [Accumulibacter sp.]